METNCNNDHGKYEFKEFFRKKIIKLRSFYIHAFVYATGLVVYVLKEYYGIPLDFFPLKYLNSVIMVIWTSVFLIAAIDLLASYKIFGEEWEERKMKSILEKKVKKQKWE